MKRSNRFMAVIAVILAFALTFTGVSIPVNAAATSTVKSITCLLYTSDAADD